MPLSHKEALSADSDDIMYTTPGDVGIYYDDDGQNDLKLHAQNLLNFHLHFFMISNKIQLLLVPVQDLIDDLFLYITSIYMQYSGAFYVISSNDRMSVTDNFGCRR